MIQQLVDRKASIHKFYRQSILLCCLLLLRVEPISCFSSLSSLSASSAVSSSLRMVPKTLPTASSSAASMTSPKKVLYLHWFRLGDLRLHDNPALCQTIANAKKEKGTISNNSSVAVLPIFIFDTSTIFGHSVQTPFQGGWKCGPRRAKFVLESVQDLRQSLEQQGSGLLVRVGKPEQVVAELLQSIQAYHHHHNNNNNNTNNNQKGDAQQQQQQAQASSPAFLPKMTCQDEVCSEEREVEQSLRSALRQFHPQSKVDTVWGSTLYHVDDLPFSTKDSKKGLLLNDMPDVFTPFRTKVEKHCRIGSPLPTPSVRDWQDLFPAKLYQYLSSSSSFATSLPTSLLDLGYTQEEVDMAHRKDDRAQMEFVGGEHMALQRLQDYIWTNDRLQCYFDTRNGMLQADDSSKFSPWLAHGCLSPRMVAQQCQKYEQERVANKSTYWLVFELLWRDFFKFFALKHGSDIFQMYGITSTTTKREWGYNPDWIQAWKDGKTGFPLVDANMRELAATGFMSNRGRQNVCSFLALDLEQDWRYGAYHFESLLLDYDVYSNYGNWCSGAGVTGGRINRFNVIKQSRDYDQHGEYLRHWLPELRKVPTEFVHEPWKMNQLQQVEYECNVGVDYPNPIIPPSRFRSVPAGVQDTSRQPSNDRGRKNGRSSDKNNNNSKKGDRRGTSGQRYDMKSLKVGTYRLGDKS